MKRLILALVVLAVLALPARVSAQTVIAPTTATFTYADTDLGTVTGFFLEYFLCTLSAGVCTPATAPFQVGTTVPKASVTGPAAARVISLTVPPESTVLASMPTGSAFVGTISGMGDPAVGFVGNSARSAASNPFYARGALPAVPGPALVR